MEIKSIMCCCGGGVGSSFMVQLNVQSLLKKHGIEGVSVDHVSVPRSPWCRSISTWWGAISRRS